MREQTTLSPKKLWVLSEPSQLPVEMWRIIFTVLLGSCVKGFKMLAIVDKELHSAARSVFNDATTGEAPAWQSGMPIFRARPGQLMQHITVNFHVLRQLMDTTSALWQMPYFFSLTRRELHKVLYPSVQRCALPDLIRPSLKHTHHSSLLCACVIAHCCTLICREGVLWKQYDCDDDGWLTTTCIANLFGLFMYSLRRAAPDSCCWVGAIESTCTWPCHAHSLCKVCVWTDASYTSCHSLRICCDYRS